ncbi:uncharacterized protein A1O5_05146 [Cladophialophora psammophila CBS 110553]|uniref:Uncharacterized protein n=1 Tax=Cladophialophora psammophila CBS 110553 TaxID=1182543 RepID=W9X222_9EURO|nr:uncharacterized protein A1O5_05146 [Cladophialophora psammophila CBS 110553]EXJ71340.1 hypothetical protein A1O5_05146 [Cladophialophora psammophila CBS 110553]
MATTTTWDAIVFVLSYALAVFLTVVDAQACNGNMTATVSLVKTITETVSLISGPPTVTVTEGWDGFNFTHVTGTTFPGVAATTATVTDTITVGNETSFQSTSVVGSAGSGSATTVTSTTKITSDGKLTKDIPSLVKAGKLTKATVNSIISASGPAMPSPPFTNITRGE